MFKAVHVTKGALDNLLRGPLEFLMSLKNRSLRLSVALSQQREHTLKDSG